jgi:hypothetical protein
MAGRCDDAEILTPKKVPDWLPDHLGRWAASLNMHGFILQEQPTRTAMKKRMQQIKGIRASPNGSQLLPLNRIRRSCLIGA